MAPVSTAPVSTRLLSFPPLYSLTLRVGICRTRFATSAVSANGPRSFAVGLISSGKDGKFNGVEDFRMTIRGDHFSSKVRVSNVLAMSATNLLFPKCA